MSDALPEPSARFPARPATETETVLMRRLLASEPARGPAPEQLPAQIRRLIARA